MKYIELFERFILCNEVKDKFNNRIDWELIEKIKEVSLEYLDYNYTLAIYVVLRPLSDNITSNPLDSIEIYNIDYSHTHLSSMYSKVNINDRMILDNPNWGIYYRVLIYSTINEDFPIQVEESKELVNKIRNLYNRKDIIFTLL